MSPTPGFLNAQSLGFVEGLYEDYIKDPSSVSEEWRRYFQQENNGVRRIGPSFKAGSIFHGPATETRQTTGPAPSLTALAALTTPNAPLGSIRPGAAPSMDIAVRQDRLDQLIRAYRVRGHMTAKIDPLDLPRNDHAELDPAYYGFVESDLQQSFSSRTIYGTETLTLAQIIERMSNTYCRSIGVEFMHIHDGEAKHWLQERMEGTGNRIEISKDMQRRIFSALTDAGMLEEFIQKKYLGAKSFSLEGSESLIPSRLIARRSTA